MKEHGFEICRCLYQSARQQGAPSVNIISLGPSFNTAETSDGSILKEGITGCCRWAMKYETAIEWLSRFGKSKEKPNDVTL